ncbi:50S ribosomal protein L18e [Hyperthermus butylicus]|uniref:Large ribosomal subunit protein eL18 n=1 Tax=Hyperthermus butylicus (strain DSM 5456 / JCM 9403 / PLM1-5) TaxID=415426 RepID=A2BK80_HYPBU|nr:50S ribosomal protein L18e [Hyperthermus butylicus]ABM80391.1 50S ribosomal protein L18e [Hyperthermus butylicus DSM 5456]
MQTTKRTGPTNILVRMTIRKLRSAAHRNKAPIWRYVAELIERPRRLRIVVNVSKINRYTEPGDVVVVPGKVLGAGSIDHPVTVAALGFSEEAARKIVSAGGRIMHILQLIEENPRGSKVKIII